MSTHRLHIIRSLRRRRSQRLVRALIIHEPSRRPPHPPILQTVPKHADENQAYETRAEGDDEREVPVEPGHGFGGGVGDGVPARFLEVGVGGGGVGDGEELDVGVGGLVGFALDEVAEVDVEVGVADLWRIDSQYWGIARAKVSGHALKAMPRITSKFGDSAVDMGWNCTKSTMSIRR